MIDGQSITQIRKRVNELEGIHEDVITDEESEELQELSMAIGDYEQKDEYTGESEA